jgi:hypothetical protein
MRIDWFNQTFWLDRIYPGRAGPPYNLSNAPDRIGADTKIWLGLSKVK